MIVATAWLGAYVIRFETEILAAPPAQPDPFDYVLGGMAALTVWRILLSHRGLYEPRRGLAPAEESRRLIQICVLGTLVLAAGTFFWKKTPISRTVLILFCGLSTLGLVTFRMALRFALSKVREYGLNSRSVLIVGTGSLARAVFERLHDHPETGFHVIGFIGRSVAGLGLRVAPHLGGFEQLHEVASEHDIDQVILALDHSEPADPIKLLHELRDTTAAVRMMPDLRGLQTLQPGIEDFDGLPMIRLVESPLVGWNRVLKRTFDIGVASLSLVLTSPLLAAIALAIRRESPNAPVLFRQQRMGLDGRLFTMLKFRTMAPDAEHASGPVWTTRNDPRRTRLGAILRSLSLDELPQLWNVMRGEMSLVGPRPERPEFIQQFRQQLPGYMLRHKMKAGMTGWAQINGCRGNTSIERRLEYDIAYARRWSLAFDLWILLLTFLRFRDPNAY